MQDKSKQSRQSQNKADKVHAMQTKSTQCKQSQRNAHNVKARAVPMQDKSKQCKV